MNTFEMTDSIRFLKERMDAGEGDPSVLADTIESLKIDRDEKLDSAANWREENDSRIDWADKKIKELQQFKKHYQNVNKSLDYYFENVLRTSGEKEIRTDKHIIEWGRKSTRVDADLDKLPEEYVTEKVTKSADKKAIREVLKSGEYVPGARLVSSRKVKVQ